MKANKVGTVNVGVAQLQSQLRNTSNEKIAGSGTAVVKATPRNTLFVDTVASVMNGEAAPAPRSVT